MLDRLVFILLFTFSVGLIQGQVYTMSNASVTTCTGTFYDSGDATLDYQSNEAYVFTICPSTAGSQIQVTFNSFDLESGYDFLTIYDANGTSSPIGTYSGTGLVGASVPATNASGCLTFEFTSDGSVTAPGWEAAIQCLLPCQTVLSSLTSTAPAEEPSTNEIRICQGGSVTFNAQGVYPQNGTNYTQSDATSLFEWDFGDGNTQSGIGLTSVSHSYTGQEGYLVQLDITDVNSCQSSNDLDQKVAVSTTPSFVGTIAADAALCLGETTTLTGVATPTPFTFDCAPATSDSLVLPDGVGVSYSSATTLSCFGPGQTLTNVNQIDGLCLNIEHSWANDLDVRIECPSGQSVILDSFGGTGNETFLGEPIDGDEGSPTPGVGYEYCWAPSPTYGTWNAEAASFATLPAGSYASENPLTALVGCELNGDWTLTITDNLSQDNGFIFSFDVDLNAAAPPPWTYTPSITSSTWSGDPTILNPGNNPINVMPDAAGSADYLYTIIDDFGCSYDTSISISITTPPDPGLDASVERCTDQSSIDLLGILGGSPDAGGTWTGPSALLNGDQGTFDPASMSAGVYTYTVTGTPPCTVLSAEVTVNTDPPPTADAGPANDAFCSASTYSTMASATSFSSLEWTSSGDGSFDDENIEDPVYTPGASDISSGTVTLTLTATGLGACGDASDQIILSILPDTDGDTVCNDVDLDDDNDGIPDSEEGAGDTDGDGVIDRIDLDSDNDGVFDVIEAGHAQADADMNGRIDGLAILFGANGLFNSIETIAESGLLNYVIADSDGDLIIDSQEIDSDNDGCYDVIEAGYLDPDNDGLLGE